MSLEERIRRFAEQARGYLLEEFAKSLQQDTTVVKWQGFDEDGKLTVKNKDLFPTVNGLGQKYATKGSDLILDNAGTVEQRKAKRGQERTARRDIRDRQINQVNRSAVITDLGTRSNLIPRSAIIIFPEFEEDYEEVFGWIVIYHSDSYIFNANNRNNGFAICDDRQYFPFNQIYDYDSETHQNIQPATHGKCLRVSAVYAYGSTYSYVGIIPQDGTADATATLGSLSASVNLAPPRGDSAEDYDFDYAIEETNLSQDSECEAETVLSNLTGDPFGEAVARTETFYHQFPNAKIYLQWPDDQNGNVNRITLDLNNYVDYSVYKFDRARNYAKLEDGATILYHTYSVGHVDTSYVDNPVSTTRFVPYEGDVTTTIIEFGKIYRGILHLRTNLSTGSTTSIYTPVEGYDDDDYLGYIFYNDNGNMQIWDATNLDYWDYFDDPQAIWQNAFDGDWISAFSEIAWDATAQANITDSELDLFLEISWDPVNKTWNNGLNSEPPYSVLYSDVYYYDPSTDVSQRWLDGQPHYNDYQDIENLGSVVRFSSTSQEDLPGVDDFVEVDMAGLSDPYLPNYQYKISSAEVNYNDRISKAYISYQPYPDEQENGGYP